MSGTDQTTTTSEREAAIQRLRDQQEFRVHLGVYAIVNLMLVIIWAASDGGYFWPIWTLGGWGIGVVAHAFSVYGQRPITEHDIQTEIDRANDDATGT